MPAQLKGDENPDKSGRENLCGGCSKTPLCKVISCINNEILFVDFNHNTQCSSRLSFGEGFVCTCAARMAYYLNFEGCFLEQCSSEITK